MLKQHNFQNTTRHKRKECVLALFSIYKVSAVLESVVVERLFVISTLK